MEPDSDEVIRRYEIRRNLAQICEEAEKRHQAERRLEMSIRCTPVTERRFPLRFAR